MWSRCQGTETEQSFGSLHITQRTFLSLNIKDGKRLSQLNCLCVQKSVWVCWFTVQAVHVFASQADYVFWGTREVDFVMPLLFFLPNSASGENPASPRPNEECWVLEEIND